MNFIYTRKPDYKNIFKLRYDDYWAHRSGGKSKVVLRNTLREREQIFFDWIKSGSRVLDIGCGDSGLLKKLHEIKNCEAEGIDISESVVSAQRDAGVNANIQDITRSDFKLGRQYDYIILSELLEHIPNPEEIMMKLKNNTKIFIISIPNSAFLFYRLSILFKGRFFTQWVYHPAEHLRFWSHIDFLDWLDALNFKIVESEASNGLSFSWLKLHKKFPNLFGHQMCYFVEVK